MAKIPEAVLDVLGECTVVDNTLFLPNVQLDRKTYTAVNKVLENMGGKWNRKARGHVFQDGDDPAAMLENVLLTQEIRDLRKEYQFFPTPRPIAERMCDMAELDETCSVLEPSCGDGRLADVIYERCPEQVFCVELNPDMCRKLESKPYTTFNADFLLVEKSQVAGTSRIIMNPPFSRHQDIDHILHAYSLLDDGGILVSIVSESPFFRSDKKSAAFRAFLDRRSAEVHKLESGAFHESGTEVPARIVKIRK